MKNITKLSILIALVCCGCAVSNHGVFPKLVWVWSNDAKEQRQIDRDQKQSHDEYMRTNRVTVPTQVQF